MSSISNIAGRLQHHWKQRGLAATLRFIGSRLFRHQVTAVYDAGPRDKCPPVEWADGERFIVIGPENMASDLTPQTEAFLGGARYECVSGIPEGNRLFIVAEGNKFLHRGYVFFKSRAKILLDEPADVPLIGYCYTAEAARGRGIYRRALCAERRYLEALGHERIVIDTDPANHASRKGIEAAGFTFVRTVSVWIVLNLFAIQKLQDSAKTRWRVVWLSGTGVAER